MCLQIFLLIFLKLLCLISCFNVEFRENYNVKIEQYNTQISKRQTSHFFDKASYTFDGLNKVESVPVMFPLDICIFSLESEKYAAALHRARSGIRHFTVFKMGNGNYESLFDLATPVASSLDCKAFASRGYVALAYNISEPIKRANEGSPIFEITGRNVRAVQYFAAPNLRAMYLRNSGNELTLLQAFENTQATPNLHCPYFKWSGTTFNRLGRIPCNNARRLEPFAIDFEDYVAVANYADEYGRTTVYSEIYKYNTVSHKFQLFQRIRTHGAVDVKYFSVPQDDLLRNHFLIFGNSMNRNKTRHDGTRQHLEADSVFYVYDKGQFVPYQSLSFYAVERFMPLQNADAEKFLLFVASNKQDIKIYNLNDWKFEESKVQFTEGALSRGVAKMRTYMENGQSYLVIANELMADNETNIFQPIFKQDEHANVLRQQIIDWARLQHERLAVIDVDELQKQVGRRLGIKPEKPQARELPQEIRDARIQSVETLSFIYPQLKLTTNYWQALGYAKRALDVLERADNNKQRSPRSAKKFVDVNEFKQLEVDTLMVREHLQAHHLNGIDSQRPEYKQVSAAKVYVSGSYTAPKPTMLTKQFVGSIQEDIAQVNVSANELNDFDVLNVENLQLMGSLNGHSWHDLMNNTLKREGLQFVKAPAHISHLETEAMVVTHNKINGQNLRQLIPIDGGDYVVQQNVQFAAPVSVKELQINERLNNIHVHNKKFDVLLKRANGTQVIQGAKRFEKLKVLEPITVAGRMHGPQLRALAPIKVTHQALHLRGDYSIAGDVSIGEQLNVNDVVDLNTNTSLKSTLDNAIDMKQATVDNVNLNFSQPIKAHNARVTHINKENMQELLQLNTESVQIVEGMKIIKNDLQVVHGFSEVKILNGVDVDALPTRLLLKHTNQSIEVPMHVGKISVDELHAQNITLQKHPLAAYLTGNGAPQQVTGTLFVDKLNVGTLTVKQLNTNGDIFAHKLQEIYQRKSKSTPNIDLLLQPDQKFHGNIYVKQLWLNTSLNDISVDEVQRQLQLLSGNIKYIGDFQFEHDVSINSLTFGDTLNGIDAEDFGKCWLTKDGAQNFTAPQTLAGFSAKQDIQLSGRLNGYALSQYAENTYRLDQAEQLPTILFENAIDISSLRTGTVNGLKVPFDMLHSLAEQPQVLRRPALVRGTIQSADGIWNVSTFNALDLRLLSGYLSGSGYDTLHVEHATFATPPIYKTLNQHDLESLLDTVWLANENIELNAQQLELTNASFVGLLDFEGEIINNVNLSQLKRNYLSLSRPQEIIGTLNFAHDVTFEQTLNARDIQQRGPLVVESGMSQKPFDFNAFVSNTLKIDGPHNITGKWSMLEAVMRGDLHNVRVNKLNLSHDVLQLNVTNQQIIGPKQLQGDVIIKKLFATPRSTIAGVPIAEWVNDAVYIYENHTIHGTTTLETVNLYNDLRVDGFVNQIKFNAENLMLRDREQLVEGDLQVRNILHNAEGGRRILTHNIESLQIERINGLPIHQLYANLAQNRPNLKVASHLIFTQPLAVGNYNIGQLPRDANMQKWKRSGENNNSLELPTVNWSDLEQKVLAFKETVNVRQYVLDHFELRQYLPLNASDVLPFTLQLDAKHHLHVIGILQNIDNNEILEYYTWNAVKEEFVLNDTLNWLPRNKKHLALLKLLYDDRLIRLSDYKKSLETISVIVATNDKLASLRLTMIGMPEHNCFASYGGSVGTNTSINIFCRLPTDTTVTNSSKLPSHFEWKIPNRSVKQLLSLYTDTVAYLNEEGNAVALWQHKNKTFFRLQTINCLHAELIASGTYAGTYYLAIMSMQKPQNGLVEIYSSKHGQRFGRIQSIECIAPVQMLFNQPPRSAEFLLHLLTASAEQPLLVYQYKGAVGFYTKLSDSILPRMDSMHLIALNTKNESRQFLALIKQYDAVYLVETVLQPL